MVKVGQRWKKDTVELIVTGLKTNEDNEMFFTYNVLEGAQGLEFDKENFYNALIRQGWSLVSYSGCNDDEEIL